MRNSSEQEEANQKHDASGGTESEQEAAAGSATFHGNMQTFIIIIIQVGLALCLLALA